MEDQPDYDDRVAEVDMDCTTPSPRHPAVEDLLDPRHRVEPGRRRAPVVKAVVLSAVDPQTGQRRRLSEYRREFHLEPKPRR